MNKRPETTIDDVLIAVNDLATLFGNEIESLRGELKDTRAEMHEGFQAVESELQAIRREQREMREWLERIDNRFVGFETDIKEIYDRIIVLEERSAQLTPNEYQELETKLEAMIAWAQKVSQKTGVPLPKL